MPMIDACVPSIEKWYNTHYPMTGDTTLTTHRMRYSPAYPKGAERFTILLTKIEL